MVYIFPIVLTLLLIYHYDYRGHKEGRMVWYILLLIYCILVAGLRYRIGGDTVVYSTNHYKNYPNLVTYWTYDFSEEKFGRGYVLLNAVARSLSDDFTVMQIILAVIVNPIIFSFFYKNTTKIFTALLFYFILCYLNYNMEVLRESCAICIFLISWKYFYQHKWIKYYLLCAVAILFHPSAAITLVLPLFTLKKLNKAFSISWFSIVLAFGLYGLGIFLTSRFFDIIRLIGFATLDNYADIYEDTGFGEETKYNIVGKLIDILNYIVYPFIVGWLLTKRQSKCKDIAEDSNFIKALLVMILSYSYIGCLSSSLLILYRFNNYLIVFLILGFADTLFHSFKLLSRRFTFSYGIWMIFIFPILAIPINRLFNPSGKSNTAFIHRYYPYYSVLNPKTDSEREKIHFFYLQ